MNEFCTIQIFLDQKWQDCAIVELLEDAQQGWHAKTRTSYLFEYAIGYMNNHAGQALAYHYPVSVQSEIMPTWPAFLLDLLPQGYGRKELLKQLNYAEYAEQHADWALLKAGASNPIGHLRIKEAHEWLTQQTVTYPNKGFTLEEITERKEYFIESLASYGLFVGGSSGVQGEWPKLLLTQAHDDLFYLDHTLPDHQAKRHWLVKFSRGQDQRLEKILSQEAYYMQLAIFLDLRVHADLMLLDRTLFIPRFDREIKNGQVQRIAQESLASLSNKAGFGVKLSHNQVCNLIMQSCTDPMNEIIEYLKRDMANVALGNKDNHTRNTAIQRFTNGQIQLTPLFDFAPMWLHPDGIARNTRWEKDDLGGAPVWASVIQQISNQQGISEHYLKQALIAELPIYRALLNYMQDLGMDREIINNSAPRIENICLQLEALNNG